MLIYKARINELSDIEYNNAFSMMSNSRKEAVLRKKIENDRKRSVLGESLARKGISEHCGIAQSEVRFGRTANGKPFCENANIYFSISHSRDLAVCAVSDKQIGIDVEFIRDIDLRIMRIACTESDKEFISSTADEGEQRIRFFTVWTAKEAYFKYLGTGIEHLREVSYGEIAPFCKMHTDGDYMITAYEK